MVYTIKTLKSSLRNNILITFFLIIALGGIIANFIFTNQFESIIIKAGLDNDVINELGRNGLPWQTTTHSMHWTAT